MRSNEAWRTWVSLGRPFVIYKAAMTLDGSVTVPGERWVSGEESRHARARAARGGGRGRRRRRHGAPTGRASTRATSTRRAASRGGSSSRRGRCRRARPRAAQRPLEEELRALAAEGVQSLLLEGGPTLAAAFLEADLVDKLLVFVAPTLAGQGPASRRALPSPRTLSHLTATPVGDDVLLEAYVHEP